MVGGSQVYGGSQVVVTRLLIMASIWGSQVSFFLDIFLIELRNLLHHASLKRQHVTLQSNLLCVKFIKKQQIHKLETSCRSIHNKGRKYERFDISGNSIKYHVVMKFGIMIL